MDVASLLRRRHRLGQADDDFELQDQDALYATRLSAGGSMRRLVAGLAALALVLGGSGLLAVCLLSVRERRSEIGLRLAVGARRRDIFVQFLAEAILLSLLGTAAGLAVTFTVIAVGERLLGWPLAIGRFGHRLRQAETAAAGLAELRRHRPDLLILDIMLPDRDGLSVCRAIRTESDVPILMLTARGEVADRVVGLEMGADDYLPQPFEPREFTTYCAG